MGLLRADLFTAQQKEMELRGNLVPGKVQHVAVYLGSLVTLLAEQTTALQQTVYFSSWKTIVLGTFCLYEILPFLDCI